MLGVLCGRSKPWILISLFNFIHGSSIHYHQSRIVFHSPIQFDRRQRHHSSACKLSGGGAASIWHAILPSGAGSGTDIRPRPAIHSNELKGEGSWNVAVDTRPARWLHRADSAWLLFGVCACISPIDLTNLSCENVPVANDEKKESPDSSGLVSDGKDESFADYRITGVLADGRCLFRAIAHGACLKCGEEAPDDNRQRELADELRAKVVDELLKRREETEWFIEGDFDAYVKRIQQAYVWGGEPELLMASHVLKSPISVFMRDLSSGGMVNIAKYGEEYHQKHEEESPPINVLFHGYGHYDILETSSGPKFLKDKSIEI